MKRSKRKSSTEKKLDLILRREEQVLAREKRIEAEEAQEAGAEKRIETIEEQTMRELKDLERLEAEIKEQVKVHPLKKIGARDLLRGLAGAFVGVVVHNALYYGTEIAEHLNGFRIIIWFILGFAIGAMLLYATGYRKIEDRRALLFMPVRLLTLWTAALVVSSCTLFLYLPDFGHSLEPSLAALAAVQMSATIGAVTADMLGRD